MRVLTAGDSLAVRARRLVENRAAGSGRHVEETRVRVEVKVDRVAVVRHHALVLALRDVRVWLKCTQQNTH